MVLGDGGYVIQLEKRGYVKAGHWTPEAAVEHPEAGKNLNVINGLIRGTDAKICPTPLQQPPVHGM